MSHSPAILAPARRGAGLYPLLELASEGAEEVLRRVCARRGLWLGPRQIAALRRRELGLTLGEGLALLGGLTAACELEVRQARAAGDHRSVIRGLELRQLYGNVPGAVRYLREDPGERWQTWGETLSRCGGDCEDLAVAVAAELRVDGPPPGPLSLSGEADPWAGRPVPSARPVVYRARPGLLHVVVDTPWGVVDPSRIGGMGAP